MIDLKLPKMGEGADSGVVVSLFVKEGETVAKDQPVVEIESEKAVASIPSSSAGVVAKIHVKAGDRIAVGQRILSLATDGESAEPAPTIPEPSAQSPVEPSGTALSAAPRLPVNETDEETPSDQPVAASPSIRRLALELGIDLRRIRGSERGGRIVMADLRAYVQRLERLAAQAKSAGAPAAKAAAEPVDFSKWGPITVRPLSPLRQVISRRMSESWSAVPRVSQFDDADVTRAMELRKRYAAAYERKGVRLTLTGIALKVLTRVLQQHPLFNSSLDATGGNLILKSYMHLGVAVDTEAGLMVPVIRDADKKSVIEIARELEVLATKARERKISTEDLKGGTVTVSNQGGIGSAHFTPIINLPEVAILGLGRGAIKPVWQEGRFEPRTLLPLALSYDHRVIDGGSAARFMVDLTQALAGIDEALVQI